MNKKYTILVNTCDKFDDCWNPYFKLHSAYWPDCDAKIFLNTESKVFTFPGLDIISGQVCRNIQDKASVSWSECLIRALEKIDTDIILYMQEDYFIKDTVKNEIIENYVQLMYSDENIHCIHLTDQAVISNGESPYPGLHNVLLKQRYRVSCQAALWKKDILLLYLRNYESAWEFEEFGSKRAAILKHNFYVVDPHKIKINEFEIIPYIFTGIIQGRWNEDVRHLFDINRIEIDYKKRGFLKNAPRRTIILKIKTFSKKIPIYIRSTFDLWRLNATNFIK